MLSRGQVAAFEPLDTTAQVETPEHVCFNHQLAGPARRGFAYAVDLLVRGAIGFCVAMVLVLTEVTPGLDGISTGLMLLTFFVLEWGYFVFFEVIWSGRTPGKRAFRIRVVREGGHSLTVLDSLLRNLLRAADFLPYFYALGLVVMGRDEKFRRIGDLVAGTVVVVEETRGIGAPLNISPPPSAEELAHFPARPPVTNEELESIELFLRRQGTLAPMREHELAEVAAPVFARRLGLRYQDPVRFLALVWHQARGRNQVRFQANQANPAPTGRRRARSA